MPEEPKSTESTNSTTSAYKQPEDAFGCYLFSKIIRRKSRETRKPSLRWHHLNPVCLPISSYPHIQFFTRDGTGETSLRWQHLNPMSLPIPPHPHILFYFSRDGLQQYRNPIRLPVAVPEIFCSLFAHKSSTAATRSARVIRHWRRSHRFPIPPHPQMKIF